MEHHIILRVLSKLLIPMIMVYALYVQFHGDFGPGGGFQAGALFAVGLFLYALVFGLDEAQEVFPLPVVKVLAAGGVLLYAGVGVASMIAGGNYLDYGALDPENRPHGEHIGILLVELGVGMTVAAVMIGLFYMFAGSRDTQDQGSGSDADRKGQE